MIAWENYEEYMMMHADGELNPAEEQALMAFVEEHPELKKELAAYTMTKLLPDNTVVFESKNLLLKPDEKKRIVLLPVWQRYSIAAGIAALLFITLFRHSNPDNAVAVNTPSVKTVNPDTRVNSAPVTHDNATRKPDAVAAIPQVLTPASPVKAFPVKQKSIMQQSSIAPHKEAIASVAVQATIDKIDPMGIKKMSDNSVAVTMPAATLVPSLPESVDEEGGKRSFFDKLPLDDIKKQNMQHMATAFANGMDRVNALKQGIDETSVTIKVERRKLIVSF